MAVETGNKALRKKADREPAQPSENLGQILLQRARQRLKSSHQWNVNTLVVAYILLAVTIIVAIRAKSDWIVALVAVLGLAIVWLIGRGQGKKQEEKAVDQEIKQYLDFMANQNQQQPPSSASAGAPLSERELDVLRQIASGKSNKQVALSLYISQQTVKNHLKHVFDKLNVNDRTSAVLVAMRNGWIGNVKER